MTRSISCGKEVVMRNRMSMNKKQRIVMWVMAVALVVAAVVARAGESNYLSYIGFVYIPLVAVGVLLIYLFRDRD